MALVQKALAGALFGAFAFAGAAHAAAPPVLNNGVGYGWTITLNPGGMGMVAQDGVQPTFDAGLGQTGDDTYIRVINNSGITINSLNLSSNSSNPIFAFDGDGIDAYGVPGNTMDLSGYGGANAYFTNIALDENHGTVTFIGGIAAGGQNYFSLESNLSGASFDVSAPGPVPGTGVLGFFALALGAAALKMRERFAR